MDQVKLVSIGAVVVLAGVVAWQWVTIAGLEGRLAALETRGPESAGPAEPARNPAEHSPLVTALRDGVPAPSAGAVAEREAIAELVAEETRRAEDERRERGREVWLANMQAEIETFGEEEELSPEVVERLQLYGEDYLLTLTDFRRAIFEGDISPEAGREEMKAFRTEHEDRMVELIGDEAFVRLQRRIGRGGRRR